jgi:hypothetical protein
VTVFFVDGIGEHDALPVTSRPRLFGVLVDFACPTVDGDVEVFAIVVTTSVATVVDVAFVIDVEIAADFPANGHVESLVERWVHGKSILDVDNAVVLFLGQLAFFNRFSFVGVEVRPFGSHAVAPHVHRSVVGIRLLWVFSRFALRHGNIACLNRCQHHCSKDERHKGLGSHG